MNAIPTRLRVGGMLVGNYLISQRKAWLSVRGGVQIGRLIDQASYGRRKRDLLYSFRRRALGCTNGENVPFPVEQVASLYRFGIFLASR